MEIARTRATKDTVALLARLTNRIRKGINTATLRRFANPPGPNASPLELTMHGYSVWYRDTTVATRDPLLEARKWFDKALRLDPSFLQAVRARWATLLHELNVDPQADKTRILREMDELSRRAVGIDGSDPVSW